MGIQAHYAGAALIKFDDYTGPGLQSLGYTRDGAEEEHETFWIDVPGDENGGDAGPPVEIQYVGEIARVRLELTKWDSALIASIEANLPGGTAGLPTALTPGTLLFTNTKFYRILIDGSVEPRNFPCSVPRGGRQLNKGTKFSTYVLEFECYKHPTTGILWNTAVV